MANIQTFLDKIKSAIYGEEVRGSIVNAIEAMNEESSSAEQNTSTIISKINASTASATGTDQGTSPTASFVDKGTKFEFVFTIPKGDTGPQGPKGDIGPKGDTPPLSNIAPSSLGTASPGTGTNASREDHIHPMPTADDIRYDTNASVKQVVRSLKETMVDFEDAIVTGLNDVNVKVDQLKDDVSDITPDDTAVNGKPWTSKKTVDSLCMPLEATGNPVQVYPVEGYPLGVKVSWEPTQVGSGDPSPDNIRPITGRNAVSVTRCGKNIIQRNINVKDTTINGVDIKVHDDGSIMFNGTATGDIYFVIAGGIDKYIRAGTDYFLSGCPKNGSTTSYYLTAYINGKWHPDVGNGARIHFTDTILTGGERIEITIAEGFEANNLIFSPQLELGSTATPYEPYVGSTTDIALPETVYGGTLDVETGVVSVDYELISFNGSEDWFYNSGYNLFATTGGDKYDGDVEPIVNIYMSKTGVSNVPDKTAAVSGGVKGWLIAIRDDDYNRDVRSFAQHLAELNEARTPMEIVRKLRTPRTIQIDKNQIAALDGVNTVYADAGTLTVTGREDPRHTIVELKNAIISLGGNV